jgi:hypothetical protein
VKIVGEVEKMLGEVSGLAHNSHGKLGLIVEQANINEVRYACSVHMYQCINEL